MAILDNLTALKDVKNLSTDELKILSGEIRNAIIRVTTENGGHLSANLGIVDATVALYHTFDFPCDKLIFDVGHQCYAHKILSDRKGRFYSLRKDGGISGFPCAEESVYDAFSTGHAGTAIAAGIGYCAARDALGEDYTVISVVGDGALGNGLSLEALTSTVEKPKKFIVILNDNGMSISKNNNGFYKIIAKSTTQKSYIDTKNFFKRVFGESFVIRGLRHVRNFIKRSLNRNNHFEQYGFKYVGVIDGNNIKELVKTLNRIKNTDKAVFLHIKTTKGKGLKQAEENASMYHGIGKNLTVGENTFSSAVSDILIQAAEKDARITAISAAMKDGAGLAEFEKRFPEKFTDVGICEEYAVTLAAGMAAGGLKPVVAVYSTFLQRAYDQIVHDVCMQNLPVVFLVDRAGFVGCDGKSHQGLLDISFLRHIPNMKLFCPKDTREFADVFGYALKLNCPVAIRYPNGVANEFSACLKISDKTLWQPLVSGTDFTILACGARMVGLALKVAERFDDKARVINARSVKPLDEIILREIADKPIITLEENVLQGGFGSAVSEFYAQNNIFVRLLPIGAKDEFVPHSTVEKQFSDAQMTNSDIFNKTVAFLSLK